MGVCVHETRKQYVGAPLVADPRRITALRFLERRDGDDASCIDRDCETLLGNDLRFDANGPARADQGVDDVDGSSSSARWEGEQV
jgi:hypothetical protein